MGRYVGNTMAGFVMQSLGCEVAALNTVQFSMLVYMLQIDQLADCVSRQSLRIWSSKRHSRHGKGNYRSL